MTTDNYKMTICAFISIHLQKVDLLIIPTRKIKKFSYNNDVYFVKQWKC